MTLLRPATPLSILFFLAFVLLLLPTLSTPIIKAIALGENQGYTFGVWGYCNGDRCSNINVGYTTDTLFSDSGYDLPSGTRHSLSSILIVHPVAAFLALVCFVLAVAAHFHSPGHSPRYLLALLILTFPTLLVALLAFLVDILVFVPHQQWAIWLVLAATILILASCVVTCAMRRTLVSRKARKKRIAEHAEMNGENYMNHRPDIAALPKAESPPPLSGNTLSSQADKPPQFAAFELQKRSMDNDRTPLNPRNPSSLRDPSMERGQPTSTMDSDPNRYGGYGEYGMPGPGPQRSQSRDRNGNPLPPGMIAPMPVLRRQSSNGTMNSNRSGGPPSNYSGRGRGGYPPRGGMPPRGGFGPGRGGPQGMRGPPPPGWNGGGRGVGPMGAGIGMAVAPMMGRGQRGPPPPGYNNRFYGSREQSPYGVGRNGSPAPPIPSAVPPMPEQEAIGQAVEMDGTRGLPSPNVPSYGLRDGDGDMQGMLGQQQQRRGSAPRVSSDLPSPTSAYSSSEPYVPVRAGWNRPGPPGSEPSSQPLAPNGNANRNLAPIAGSPVQAGPVELPARASPVPPPTIMHHTTMAAEALDPNVPREENPALATYSHARTVSEDYYEDVDPRFAEPSEVTLTQQAPSSPLPTSLVPGYAQHQQQQQQAHAQPMPPPHQRHLHPDPHHLHPDSIPHIDRTSSSSDIADGARSAATSEASNFTSISQRGINPNWRPQPPPASLAGPGGYGPAGYGPAPGRMGPRREDVLLEANPDFALPGGPGPRGRGGPVRGGFGRGVMPGPRGGLTGVGRYPGVDTL